MVSELTPTHPDTLRQPHPIGDIKHGQYVQANKAIPTKKEKITWTLGRESLAVSSTVVQLAKRQQSFEYALITVDTNSVKFTLDGTTPTSTVGQTVVPNGQVLLEGVEEISNFKVIRVSADATLQVTYGNVL